MPDKSNSAALEASRWVLLVEKTMTIHAALLVFNELLVFDDKRKPLCRGTVCYV